MFVQHTHLMQGHSPQPGIEAASRLCKLLDLRRCCPLTPSTPRLPTSTGRAPCPRRHGHSVIQAQRRWLHGLSSLLASAAPSLTSAAPRVPGLPYTSSIKL